LISLHIADLYCDSLREQVYKIFEFSPTNCRYPRQTPNWAQSLVGKGHGLEAWFINTFIDFPQQRIFHTTTNFSPNYNGGNPSSSYISSLHEYPSFQFKIAMQRLASHEVFQL
jgi:hypothetical protein